MKRKRAIIKEGKLVIVKGETRKIVKQQWELIAAMEGVTVIE